MTTNRLTRHQKALLRRKAEEWIKRRQKDCSGLGLQGIDMRVAELDMRNNELDERIGRLELVVVWFLIMLVVRFEWDWISRCSNTFNYWIIAKLVECKLSEF